MIETSRLLLRRWKQSDLEPFAKLNSDSAVMRFFPDVLSRSASDALAERIQDHFAQHGFGLFAAELRWEEVFIGFIGLSIPPWRAAFTPCVEIGWRLAQEHWNRGLATEGATAVVLYARDVLRLDEIVSFTVPSNLPSRRVMEKLGMTHDPSDDFDHPKTGEGQALRRHVLYRLRLTSRASGQ